MLAYVCPATHLHFTNCFLFVVVVRFFFGGGGGFKLEKYKIITVKRCNLGFSSESYVWFWQQTKQ